MKSQIYVQDLKNEKRLVSNNLTSDFSGKQIEKSGFLIRCFSRSFENNSFVVSQEELSEIKSHKVSPYFDVSLYDYYEYNLVIRVSRIPRGSYLFLDNTPNLRDSKAAADVFTAASKQLSGEVVKDNTKCAGRFRLNQQEDSLTLEERDQKLLERDEELNSEFDNPSAFLQELQFAGEKEQKELEVKQTKQLR